VDTHRSDWLEQITAHCGGSADGALEATGDAALANALLGVLSPGAWACAYGIPPTGRSYDARWQEPSVEEFRDTLHVHAALSQGQFDMDWWVSHHFSFEECVEAFERNRRGEIFKGVIEF
jgi:threonine dehydrogenase-like Zn-dependent dehydrogenase